MGAFTTYILLIIFTIIFGISQSSDYCFYQLDQRGRKCFDESHTTYTCCPHDHHCQQGKCTPLSATLPPKHIPIHIYILIGVGVALIGLISIIIGAIYWQRRQIKQTEKSFEPSATFSQPSNISFRNNSSVGSLRHASTSEPSSVEATVNKETSTTA